MVATTAQNRANDQELDEISKSYALRKKNAALLAAGYGKGKRAFEIFNITAWSTLFLYNAYRYYTFTSVELFADGVDPTLKQCIILKSAIYVLAASLFADVVSGILHWTFDTWGTLETPIFGPTFIRSFREHHVNPASLAAHDWIEANGDSCFAGYLVVIPMFFAKLHLDLDGPLGIQLWWDGIHMTVSYYLFCAVLIAWLCFTNQIHKWAHTLKPPPIVQWLQDHRFIMSKPHHHVHHTTPYETYYCITNGWMNGFLAAIGFWRGMEATISFVTGAVPRDDDRKWWAGDASLGKEANPLAEWPLDAPLLDAHKKKLLGKEYKGE